MVNEIDYLSNCYATISSICYLFKHNRFLLKVGTFAQKKSSSTLFAENLLANWQLSSQQLSNVIVTLSDVIQKGSQVCMTGTSLC